MCKPRTFMEVLVLLVIRVVKNVAARFVHHYLSKDNVHVDDPILAWPYICFVMYVEIYNVILKGSLLIK